MARGKHIYLLNENLKELEQKVNYSDDERNRIQVNDKYYISCNNNNNNNNNNNLYFCYDTTEVLNTIQEQITLKKDETEKQLLTIIYAGDMNQMLEEFIKSGYVPKIAFSSFVYKISITLNNFLIFVECCDNNPIYGRDITFESKDEYTIYNKAYQLCYDAYIKTDFLSETHPTAQTIEDTYKILPCTGYFEKYYKTPLNALDERKAYTSHLLSITKIPIFYYFDVYMPYKNEPIEDLTYYIIEVLDITNETIILFNNKFSRTYGFILKSLNNIKYKILYQRKPYKIESVDFKKPIDDLYENNQIAVHGKKMIINKITGLLEKKKYILFNENI